MRWQCVCVNVYYITHHASRSRHLSSDLPSFAVTALAFSTTVTVTVTDKYFRNIPSKKLHCLLEAPLSLSNNFCNTSASVQFWSKRRMSE